MTAPRTIHGGAVLAALAALLGTSPSSRADFERPAFPDTPDEPHLVPANPAALARLAGGPCGTLGHDRPFGLHELSGHHVLLSWPEITPPGLGRLRPGIGLATRGPARHREQAALAAIGWAPQPWLALGGGVYGLRLAPGSGRRWSRWVPLAGARLAPFGGWALAGWHRGASGRQVESSQTFWLVHTAADGNVSVGARLGAPLSAHRSMRWQVRLTRRLGDSATLGLEVATGPRQYGIRLGGRRGRTVARLEMRSHNHLGATPAWSLSRRCG